MTAFTGNCPCVQRMGIPVRFTDPSEAVTPNANCLCIYCGRGLRTNAGALPRRVTFDDEMAPGEQGEWVASRARGQGLRGKPFDNAPPINPRPRPPHDPGGNPA